MAFILVGPTSDVASRAGCDATDHSQCAFFGVKLYEEGDLVLFDSTLNTNLKVKIPLYLALDLPFVPTLTIGFCIVNFLFQDVSLLLLHLNSLSLRFTVYIWDFLLFFG